MKLVIIGGTGLIGSKLVTRLREHGHEVVPASPDTASTPAPARAWLRPSRARRSSSTSRTLRRSRTRPSCSSSPHPRATFSSTRQQPVAVCDSPPDARLYPSHATATTSWARTRPPGPISTPGPMSTTWNTRAPAVTTLASSLACSHASARAGFWNSVGGLRDRAADGDYRFVRVDRTSPYVVTVGRRPRRSGRRPYWHKRHSALRLENR